CPADRTGFCPCQRRGCLRRDMLGVEQRNRPELILDDSGCLVVRETRAELRLTRKLRMQLLRLVPRFHQIEAGILVETESRQATHGLARVHASSHSHENRRLCRSPGTSRRLLIDLEHDWSERLELDLCQTQCLDVGTIL